MDFEKLQKMIQELNELEQNYEKGQWVYSIRFDADCKTGKFRATVHVHRDLFDELCTKYDVKDITVKQTSIVEAKLTEDITICYVKR